MNLEAYLQASSGWLVDAVITYDMAAAAALASNPNWTVPDTGLYGPYFVSRRSAEAFGNALPLAIRSSKEAMQAAWVALGDSPAEQEPGKIRVPHANRSDPRTGGILARAGVIAQFELWKSYVRQLPDYPFSKKAADRYTFGDIDEERTVRGLIDLRNCLTHEIDPNSDPSMERLVSYAWECQLMAKLALERHGPNAQPKVP